MAFTETTFRKTVKAGIEKLGEQQSLKIGVENINTKKMEGKSISEGGDVDILYSPAGEVIYVDFM